MFPKSQRINSIVFKKIFTSGKRYFSPFFRVYIFPGDTKVSVVIPKKILKKRFERNREKRRITHICKKHLINNNKQYIFVIQKNTQFLSFQELETEIVSCIKKTEK